MKKQAPVNIKRLTHQIISEVSKLDIDEQYRAGVFAALLTRALLTMEQGKPTERSSDQMKAMTSGALSLPDRIIKIRDSGFFKEPRSDQDVYAKIAKEYKCSRGRVSTALFRLGKRHKLRRTEKLEDGKETVAYTW